MNNIIIYLGGRCNLNCSYCHNEIEQDIKVNEVFLNTLKDFDGRIIFRGGEPTLYMDMIKQIVSVAKKSSFSITTNGILFKKYKEYFLEHNFNVYLSYDGNVQIRKYDPFKEIINYPNVYATSIITTGFDLNKTLMLFDEKSIISGHRLQFYPHIGHYTNEYNKEFAMKEYEYDILSSQIKKCIKKFVYDKKTFNTINNKFLGIFQFLNNSLNNKFIFGETACANRKSKRVDVAGQQYNCLYIRDAKLSDDWLCEQQNLIYHKFPKCVNCDVYDMCGAGCVKSLYHDRECKFYYNLFKWYKEYYINNLKQFF